MWPSFLGLESRERGRVLIPTLQGSPCGEKLGALGLCLQPWLAWPSQGQIRTNFKCVGGGQLLPSSPQQRTLDFLSPAGL